jgi:hypothetical protein
MFSPRISMYVPLKETKWVLSVASQERVRIVTLGAFSSADKAEAVARNYLRFTPEWEVNDKGVWVCTNTPQDASVNQLLDMKAA